MRQESTHGQYVAEPEHVSVHTVNTEGSSFTPPGDGGQQQNQPEPAGQPPALPPPVVPPPVMPPLAIPPVAYEQMFPAMMAHYMQHMAQLMPMFQPPPPPQPQPRIMDRVLKNLRVPDADRSELASQMFWKGAYDWWKRIDQDPHTPKPWTWDRFDRAFTKEYVPTGYREERRDQFVALKQEGMSLPELRQKFDYLSQYATSLVSTPEDRLNEFVKKLRPDLRPFAALIMTIDFNAAYDLIVKTEKSLDDLQATKKEDRATKDPRPAASTGPSGKSFGFGGKRYEKGSSSAPPPKRRKQFPADLIELPHKEFDIILGMDWLTEHRAVVDCSCRTVRLRAEDGSDVSLSGEVFPKTPEFISSLSARRLIRKKCEMFLCHVQDMRKESPRQPNIRTVCDFPDVFPEDLPGLPPPREVEFSINLIPGNNFVIASVQTARESELWSSCYDHLIRMSQESTHGQYVAEPEHVSVHTVNTEGSSFTPPGDGGQQQNQPEPAGQPPALPPPVVPPPVMPPLAIPPVAYEQMFPAMMAHYMQHMAQLMPMFQPPPPPQPQPRIVTFKTLFFFLLSVGNIFVIASVQTARESELWSSCYDHLISAVRPPPPRRTTAAFPSPEVRRPLPGSAPPTTVSHRRCPSPVAAAPCRRPIGAASRRRRRSSPVALPQPITVAEPPAAVSPSPEIRHHRRRIAAPPRRALDVASTAGVLPRRRLQRRQSLLIAVELPLRHCRRRPSPMRQESTHGQYVAEPEHVSVHTVNTEGSSFTPPGDGGQQQNQPEPAGQPPALPPPVVPPPVMPPLAIPPVAYEQMFPAMMAHYMQHMAQLMPMFQPPPPPQPQPRIMDRVLKNLRVPDADRSELASQMFWKGAYDWWKRIDQDPHTPKPWTWDRFDRAFTKEYVPTGYREERRDQFVALKQEGMSLPELRQKFDYLSQYATSLVSTPEDRLNEFVKKLRPDLRPFAALIMTIDFNAAYDLIVKTEKSLDDLQATKKEDRATKDPRPAASTGPSGKSFGFGGKRYEKGSSSAPPPKRNPTHVLPTNAVTLDESLSYEEEPVKILARVIMRWKKQPGRPKNLCELSTLISLTTNDSGNIFVIASVQTARESELWSSCYDHLISAVRPPPPRRTTAAFPSPEVRRPLSGSAPPTTVSNRRCPSPVAAAPRRRPIGAASRRRRRSSPVALPQPIAVAEPPAAVSPSPEICHHRRRIAAPPRRALDVASTAGVLPRRRLQHRQSLLIDVELPLRHCRRRPSPSPHPAAAPS
ncbi:unnamed protein product [Cuscuta campestris]|uniref:Retrotransposon gag domain-containing protein n=1 Tax=Cuscuta campestris TaxID=132261 RepID=A0A484NST9_9ASTE|nr:unnamed protein product [Cuscuta campestris]